MQLRNISFMYCTFEVLKLLKSNEFKLEHPSNIDCISVTFDVSKDDKSIKFRL